MMVLNDNVNNYNTLCELNKYIYINMICTCRHGTLI